MNFYQKVLAGEEDPERIDDYIVAWHQQYHGPLPVYAFLGLSKNDYKFWVEHPSQAMDEWKKKQLAGLNTKRMQWIASHLTGYRRGVSNVHIDFIGDDGKYYYVDNPDSRDGETEAEGDYIALCNAVDRAMNIEKEWHK